MNSREQRHRGISGEQGGFGSGGVGGLNDPDASAKGGATASESRIQGPTHTSGINIKGLGQESGAKAVGVAQGSVDSAKQGAQEAGSDAEGDSQGAHWGMEHGMVLRRHVGLRNVDLRREPLADGESFMFVVNGFPVYAKGEQACLHWIQSASWLYMLCCAKHASLQASDVASQWLPTGVYLQLHCTYLCLLKITTLLLP